VLLVDSHCHLDHWREDEIEAVVGRAAVAGVGFLVTIGVRLGAQSQTVRRIASAHPRVWGTVGIHPHNAGLGATGEEGGEPGAIPTLDALLAEADHPRIVGIGESGLDYFYDHAPRDVAALGFRRHIEAARASGLPLVVHARDADDDVAAILEDEHARGAFPFLLHCFSSGAELARRAVRLGGYVSFSGILTFPKSDAIRAIAAGLPEERLLVETDSPYLSPVPFRGKRCEPAYVAHTARVLAQVRGLPEAELARIVTANTGRLFTRLAPALQDAA